MTIILFVIHLIHPQQLLLACWFAEWNEFGRHEGPRNHAPGEVVWMLKPLLVFPNKLIKKWRGCIDEMFVFSTGCHRMDWQKDVRNNGQGKWRCSFLLGLLGVSLPWYPGGALPTPLGDETQVRSIRTGRRDYIRKNIGHLNMRETPWAL